METNSNIRYAGFWTRLLAFVIDIVLISLITSAMKLTMIPFVGFVLIWLYFAFSISRWGTTAGGKLLGIEFYSEEGNRLSFLKASLRWFVSMLPFIIYQLLREMQHTMSPSPSPEVQMLPQLIFILAPFVMFLTRKRQMLHDMAVKSIVVDVNKASIKAKEHQTVKIGEDFPPKPIYYGRMAIRIVGVVLFLIMGGYVVLYTSVFYKLGKAKTEAYNRSFHTAYHTEDFNDSRIVFYQKELERYSKAFIEAEGMYDIFAADVKRDLALNCIKIALKEHNVTDWVDMGDAFRKNARNKFANNETTIKKAKANEDWMGRHFYDYDLNDVNHIEDQIANVWEKDKNRETCDALMPVEKMFEQRFVPSYIANREEATGRYRWELAHAKSGSYPKPSFYREQVATQTAWLKTLKAHNPVSFNILHKQRAKEAQQQKEAEAKREQKEEEEKQKALWQCVEENRCRTPFFFKDMNANIRNEQGQTPLMVAVKNEFYNAIDALSKANVDVRAKDNEGKTAFDYIKTSASREEWIHSSRIYGLLRALEVEQIVRGKAKIVQYSYNSETDMLSLTIKGARCEAFVFPKHTQCTALKAPSKHPIFKAIREKDNHTFDKLLSQLTNLSIRNKHNYTPLWTAILKHNYYAVEKLLDAGVDMYEIDPMDLKTPVYWTAMTNDTKLLQQLLQHGADVESKNIFGDTALSTAAQKCNNFEAVKMLLNYGANPYQKDKHGENTIEKVLHRCKDQAKKEKMVHLLKEGSHFSKEAAHNGN